MKSGAALAVKSWLPWVILLLFVGGALRLVNLNAPPLDFQPTRQLRNSLVARAIYYNMMPDADPARRDLADSFRRAVGQYEPPIFETMVGSTFLITGGESFAVPRLYGTLFWLSAGLALFALARRVASAPAALVGLAYYVILPFGVQASRSFQPDPLMTASAIAGLYFLYRWSDERRWKWTLLAGLLLGFSVLVKIVIVFLVAAVAVVTVFVTLKGAFWRSAQVWAMVALMTVPAGLYYLMARPGRSAEYFFAWTIELLHLITSVHFYADWLGFVGSLLGLTMLFLSLIGTALAPSKFRWMLIALWLGYLIYGLFLPFQMYTHSYYHLQLVPLVALGLVPVADVVVARTARLEVGWRWFVVASLIGLIGYEAWAARSALVVEDFSEAPALWSQIGGAIPENADVIALTQDYGFDLMYWGWRKVHLWPLSTGLSEARGDKRELATRFGEITAGNDYFLVTAFGQLDSQPGLADVLTAFPVVSRGEGYILYDLRSSQ